MIQTPNWNIYDIKCINYRIKYVKYPNIKYRIMYVKYPSRITYMNDKHNEQYVHKRMYQTSKIRIRENNFGISRPRYIIPSQQLWKR